MKLNRRQFLGALGATGVVLMAPPSLASTARGRVLVLVELAGGNDGLNTVIPYRQDRYRALRPGLAVPRSDHRTLDDEVALHPALEGLSKSWDAGELAIVQGVGYPSPNRSHFRSIEIWEGGTDADVYDERGWLSRVLPPAQIERLAPATITIGATDDGPLAGAGSVAMSDPEELFGTARRLQRVESSTDNPALAHIVETQNALLDAVDNLGRHTNKVATGARFDGSALGRPMQNAADMIMSGLPVYAIRLRLGGFDTHVNQARRHARLLEVLDGALADFRAAMEQVGRWDDVLVVTYSEFGRRPRENGGGGTDHGTAAPQFVLGGKVRGGRYGEAPSLHSLDDNGDLRHTTDFRRVYATIADRWWGIHDHDFRDFKEIPLLPAT